MGACFHWFKEYTIIKNGSSCDTIIFSEEGDNILHSYKTLSNICNAFKDIEYKFPQFDTVYFKEEYVLSLISPLKMIKLCDELLQREDIINKYDIELKYLIEWFKDLSQQGYYMM